MSVHGTARYAVRDELRAKGFLPARAAPGELLIGFFGLPPYDFEPIRYHGDLHQLIVAGTGGGKFTTALAPMLLGSGLDDHTVVAVDPKGELARLVGPVFQEPYAARASVILLDPWDQCGTGRTAVLNVLATITADNPNYVDDARALADAMVIPSGAENTHWDNAARNFLTALLLYVALDPAEDGRRDLVRVRELATLSWAMNKAYTGPRRPTLSALLFEHLASDLADGAVRHGFTSLLNREEKERSGILSSIERDTAWIDSPQMRKVLQGPSLDLSEVADGGNKYFVVLPPDFFITHRAWLRLMVTAFAKAMKRHRPRAMSDGARWRHIVIDEFANLGEMTYVLNDVAVARGYAVKYHLAVQDLAQLKRVYEDGWESFINNSFQRFFSVGDLFTAEYVARLAGVSTVTSLSSTLGTTRNNSVSTTRGRNVNRGTNFGPPLGPASHSAGEGESGSISSSESTTVSDSQSASQVQRPLMTADEVRRLPDDTQLLCFRGMHLIWSWRPPYWQIFRPLPDQALKDVLATVGQPRLAFPGFRLGGRRETPALVRAKRRPWLRRIEQPLELAFGWALAAGLAVFFYSEWPTFRGMLWPPATYAARCGNLYVPDPLGNCVVDRTEHGPRLVQKNLVPPSFPTEQRQVSAPPTRKELGAKLRALFPTVTVYDTEDLLHSRGRDDPFARALQGYEGRPSAFVMVQTARSMRTGNTAELGITCDGHEPRWIFNVAGLGPLPRPARPTVYLAQRSRAADHSAYSFPNEVSYSRPGLIIVIGDIEISPGDALVTRLSSAPLPPNDFVDTGIGSDGALFFHNADLDRRKEFCSLQHALLPNQPPPHPPNTSVVSSAAIAPPPAAAPASPPTGSPLSPTCDPFTQLCLFIDRPARPSTSPLFQAGRANVPSTVDPNSGNPFDSGPRVTVPAPDPSKPQFVWYSPTQRQEIEERLRTTITNPKTLYNISDMPRMYAADDPFLNAVGALNAPRFEFILKVPLTSVVRGSFVNVAVVCGRDRGIHWIVDLRALDDRIGSGPPIVHPAGARPPGGTRQGFAYRIVSSKILVLNDFPENLRGSVVARLHDSPLLPYDDDTRLERVEIPLDDDLRRRAEFCDLQRRLVPQ